LAKGSYYPLDYLLLMRNVNGYNHLLKEAVNPIKLVGDKAAKAIN